MNLAERYIEYTKNLAQIDPQKGWGKMQFGFRANCLRTGFLPDKQITKGYQKLEDMMMKFVASALNHKRSYLWGNIFAPCEIFESMGLSMLSIECLSCYLTGFHMEEYFIDYAQSLGIAPTLCSYHKTFVGAVASQVVPAPSFAVTTSLTCDGNLNTFRYLEKKVGVPFFLLDVPYQDDEESVSYLAEQLKDMIIYIEKSLGCHCDMEKLKKSLEIENQTRKELRKFANLLQKHYYPGRIIHQLYLMMGTHLMMGRQEFLELVQFMIEEIKHCPPFLGKRILWVHLLPFYQESLKKYFDCSKDYQIFAADIILDTMEEMNPNQPLESLAKKLLHNVFNGSYKHKANYIKEMADIFKPDAAIHFCHWGCKQADGGSAMLKEALKQENIPMLILDGDGIDKRNSHDGQIKTRLEAFLEMIGEI